MTLKDALLEATQVDIDDYMSETWGFNGDTIHIESTFFDDGGEYIFDKSLATATHCDDEGYFDIKDTKGVDHRIVCWERRAIGAKNQ